MAAITTKITVATKIDISQGLVSKESKLPDFKLLINPCVAALRR
jgi:hypothetical protein